MMMRIENVNTFSALTTHYAGRCKKVELARERLPGR
jgi:hypothetical protein